jgi:hypothetical protein
VNSPRALVVNLSKFFASFLHIATCTGQLRIYQSVRIPYLSLRESIKFQWLMALTLNSTTNLLYFSTTFSITGISRSKLKTDEGPYAKSDPLMIFAQIAVPE